MSARPADRIERTAWLAGAGALAASLPFRDATVTAGVALGVLIAVLNYRALASFVRTLLASGAPTLPRARFALHFLKYAVTAAVVAAALRLRICHPIAMLAGASVLLPAVVREAFASQHALREEEA
jgi:hypothetical protein